MEKFETEDLLVEKKTVWRYITRKEKIPTRFWIACMVFFSTYINYTARVNMSIEIVSMVTAGKSNKIPECKRNEMTEAEQSNVTNVTLPDHGPRYEWDEVMQGHILGSYFYAYSITSLPAGWVAEWIGPFHTIFWAHVITLIMNVLSVYGAWMHWGVLVFTRVIIGGCAGLIYPALQCMIARWAPPAERGRFLGALMGNTLGTCLTWPIVGVITEMFGWSWGFYFISIQMGVYCVVFWFVASDGPDKHRWISDEERDFIIEAQAGSVSKKKAVPPYKAIFTSLPFWALNILHIGNLWGLYLQLTGIPKFVAQVIGFDLKKSGGLSALPHLMRLFCGIGFGNIGDYLKKRGTSSKFIRKFFILFSHIIPGIAMISISLIGCNWVPVVGLLIVSMAINGAAVITNLQNPQDLAPNFAGTIFGIISFFGGFTGFITPALTGLLTKDNNGTKEWGLNFIIGGGVYVGCGLVFILFGSTEKQPWNEKKEDP